MAAFNLENYETVKARKKRFYEKFSDGRIIVDGLKIDSSEAIFKATIFKNSDDQKQNLPFSTGYAQEFKGIGGVANRTSWTENCEESAIGRALDNAGFSGTNTCSREEMEKVSRAEVAIEPPAPIQLPTTVAISPFKPPQNATVTLASSSGRGPTEKQVKRLYALARQAGHSQYVQMANDLCLAKYSKAPTALSRQEYDEICQIFEKEFQDLHEFTDKMPMTVPKIVPPKSVHTEDDIPF